MDESISAFASYIVSSTPTSRESILSEADAMVKLQSIVASLEKQAGHDLLGVSMQILTPTVALALAYVTNSSTLCPQLTKLIVGAIKNDTVFEASMKEAKSMTNRVAGYDCSGPMTSAPSISLDWNTAGLMFSLEAIFTTAVSHAFSMSTDMDCNDAFIARCGNPTHGDFQCNNAMRLAKIAKGLGKKYKGPMAPKEIADR